MPRVGCQQNTLYAITSLAERKEISLDMMADLIGTIANHLANHRLPRQWIKKPPTTQTRVKRGRFSHDILLSSHIFRPLEKAANAIGISPGDIFDSTWHAHRGWFSTLPRLEGTTLAIIASAISATHKTAKEERRAEIKKSLERHGEPAKEEDINYLMSRR